MSFSVLLTSLESLFLLLNNSLNCAKNFASMDSFSLSDASGYFANMYTGEDFGCVHHKLRTVEYLFGVDHAIR